MSDYAPQSPERQLEPPHLEARVVDLGERQKFKADYATWLEDSMFDSLPNMMREHHSFREIIQSGERVVPLIASELRRRPSFLFLALEDITGEDPVPDEARGNLKATVSAWLAWLRR